MSLCEFKFGQNWNLIYKASLDGFEASDFHSKCDDKSKTLVIIKSTNGNVFGGYTEQLWNNGCSFKIDPNAFIFSLINKENKPLKVKCSPNNGIRCDHNYGSVFGGNHGASDLVIDTDSNINNNSYSYFGHCYTLPDYSFNSNF
jgi:hypothetical protein